MTAPTCTEKGYTTYTCSRCGDSYRGRETEALGHDYKDGVCIRCGEASPNPVPVNPFKDVKADAYYYDPVLWAIEKGITTGTSKTTFSPESGCTRGQIVTFLYRDMK